MGVLLLSMQISCNGQLNVSIEAGDRIWVSFTKVHLNVSLNSYYRPQLSTHLTSPCSQPAEFPNPAAIGHNSSYITFKDMYPRIPRSTYSFLLDFSSSKDVDDEMCSLYLSFEGRSSGCKIYALSFSRASSS